MSNSPTVEGAISRARRVVPNQRIAQVIANAVEGDLFYQSDELLAQMIHAYLDKMLETELRGANSAGGGRDGS